MLAVVAAVAAVAAGVVRGGLDDPTTTRPDVLLPDDALRGSDLAAVRFSLGLRGYRMDEVDEVLDRAAAELDARAGEIDQLGEQDDQLREQLEQRRQIEQRERFEASTSPADVPQDV